MKTTFVNYLVSDVFIDIYWAVLWHARRDRFTVAFCFMASDNVPYCVLDDDNHEEDPDGIQKLLQSSLSPRHSPIPFHHQLRQSIRSSMLKEVSYHMQINYDIYLRHPQTYYVAKMVS